MLLLLAAGLGTLGGLWHGGRLAYFARLDFRWPLIFLAGLLLRGVAFSRFVPNNTLAVALYVVAIGCLLVGMVANRRIAGIELVLIGLALNAAVILANGGAMPVSPGALGAVGLYDFALRLSAEGQVGHVELTTPDTRLRPLADIIPLSYLPGFRAVASVGDLFIAAGTLVIFYVGTLRPPAPSERRGDDAALGSRDGGARDDIVLDGARPAREPGTAATRAATDPPSPPGPFDAGDARRYSTERDDR